MILEDKRIGTAVIKCDQGDVERIGDSGSVHVELMAGVLRSTGTTITEVPQPAGNRWQGGVEERDRFLEANGIDRRSNSCCRAGTDTDELRSGQGGRTASGGGDRQCDIVDARCIIGMGSTGGGDGGRIAIPPIPLVACDRGISR